MTIHPQSPSSERGLLVLAVLARIVAAVLLFIALGNYGRDFYVLLRWFVFGATALTSYLAYVDRRAAWCWTAVIVAILFNPFSEIHLSRQTWHIIDPVVGAFLLASIFFVPPRLFVRPPNSA